jgi:hypothetical protein
LEWLVHLAGAIAGRLSDDRVEPRRDHAATAEAFLAGDEMLGVGVIFLDVFELVVEWLASPLTYPLTMLDHKLPTPGELGIRNLTCEILPYRFLKQ